MIKDDKFSGSKTFLIVFLTDQNDLFLNSEVDKFLDRAFTHSYNMKHNINIYQEIAGSSINYVQMTCGPNVLNDWLHFLCQFHLYVITYRCSLQEIKELKEVATDETFFI